MKAKTVSGRKVRYAALGAGWIAQGYFLPGVKHTGNSELAALVTGDPEKAAALKKDYRLEKTYSYEEFPQFLADDLVDALYVATPNERHTEFVVPALEAGVHVLLEKPMAIGEDDCRKMIAASEASGAKLMIAYRLHFEPATVAAIQQLRGGKFGDPRFFNSTFSQPLKPDNNRARNGFEDGPVYDMGPYPINACRNLFGLEPIEVHALAARDPNSGLGDLDDTVSVTLKFPGERLAQFIVSYRGDAHDDYIVVGTKGTLTSRPAYMFGKSLEHQMTVGAKESEKAYKSTDHFGGETKYFSDCILHDRHPEPDGEEGLCDVRVIEAIRRCLDTGQAQTLEPYTRKQKIDPAQVETLSTVRVPTLVNADSPSQTG